MIYDILLLLFALFLLFCYVFIFLTASILLFVFFSQQRGCHRCQISISEFISLFNSLIFFVGCLSVSRHLTEVMCSEFDCWTTFVSL